MKKESKEEEEFIDGRDLGLYYEQLASERTDRCGVFHSVIDSSIVSASE